MQGYFLLLLLLLQSFLIKSQTISYSGKIVDSDARAIPHAVVKILNSGLVSVTDNQGRFTFSALRTGTYTIGVSAIGYASINTEIKVSTTAHQNIITLFALNKQLDEVVVTAQKREEALQRIPVSISAFSAERTENYRLWNIKEITAIVPNFYSSSPGDNRNVSSVRGIATTSYDPAVVTYVDGVNQFGLDNYIAQLSDVERIEVLRGPQGTLYGRNAMGGVINIITKQPNNQTTGFSEVDVGNFSMQRYSGGIRTAVIKNKLFLGIAGMYQSQNGFYKNRFDDESFDDQHSIMGNYYLKYLDGRKWALTLNVKHNNNRNHGAFPLHATVSEALANPFELNQNQTTTMVDNLFNSSLAIAYFGLAVNFKSISAYQTNNRFYQDPIDSDFSSIDGVSLINNYGKPWNTVKVVTQEFHVSSPAPSANLKWITGLYSFYQDSPVKQGIHFGRDAEMMGAPFPDFTVISTNKGYSYGFAAFADATYAIGSKLHLTAGLRYDYERRKLNIRGEFQTNGEAPVETRSDTSSAASFDAFMPKVTLAYQVNDHQLVHASYSRGFRAGGISQLSSDPGQPPLYAYEPEYSSHLELDAKNRFLGDRLRVNVAAFYTNVTDAQVPTLILPEAITVIRNAGKLTSRGVELELALAVMRWLDLEWNFGYTDARYKDLRVSANGAVVQYSGNRQIFTPRATSMAALQFSRSMGRDARCDVILRTEWRSLGDQYFDLANAIKQAGYSLFNVRAGISANKFDLFFWARNLTDKTYIDYAYDFGAVHLGDPRTFGVSVRKTF